MVFNFAVINLTFFVIIIKWPYHSVQVFVWGDNPGISHVKSRVTEVTSSHFAD